MKIMPRSRALYSVSEKTDDDENEEKKGKSKKDKCCTGIYLKPLEDGKFNLELELEDYEQKTYGCENIEEALEKVSELFGGK